MAIPASWAVVMQLRSWQRANKFMSHAFDEENQDAAKHHAWYGDVGVPSPTPPEVHGMGLSEVDGNGYAKRYQAYE